MSTDLRVISPKRLPARLPIMQTIVFGLVLDHYHYRHLPDWMIGAAGAIWAVYIALCVYGVMVQKHVDPLEKL